MTLRCGLIRYNNMPRSACQQSHITKNSNRLEQSRTLYIQVYIYMEIISVLTTITRTSLQKTLTVYYNPVLIWSHFNGTLAFPGFHDELSPRLKAAWPYPQHTYEYNRSSQMGNSNILRGISSSINPHLIDHVLAAYSYLHLTGAKGLGQSV